MAPVDYSILIAASNKLNNVKGVNIYNKNTKLMKRINSIDFVRGLVMIIMAIDHIRDLMHVSSLTEDPTNLLTTTPFLFFTRWITHICAPTFVFLSGVSAYLSFKAKNNLLDSCKFLVSRGLWLIFLEFTVINFGIWSDIHFNVIIFQVIATIGCGFVILGLSLKIPPKILGVIGLVIICAHNLFPLIPFEDKSTIKMVLSTIFLPSVNAITPHTTLLLVYPPIPWLGIMYLGFGSGFLFQLPLERRKVVFLRSAAFLIILFLALRWSNLYGDPALWTKQKNDLFTFLSFMNLTKYPPSLLYCSITLGIMFMLLYFAEGINNKFKRIVCVYGKVPLFYYLIHWYTAHIIMYLLLFAQGFGISDFVFGFNFGRPKVENGLPLFGIYLVWLLIIIALYPLCKWYGIYKDKHRENRLLRYL
ncbi:MAG: hypothetical protein JWQ25_693 [Daejeonella sp.]|nr:hypothetical protein [Daejeonella sp.]